MKHDIETPEWSRNTYLRKGATYQHHISWLLSMHVRALYFVYLLDERIQSVGHLLGGSVWTFSSAQTRRVFDLLAVFAPISPDIPGCLLVKSLFLSTSSDLVG